MTGFISYEGDQDFFPHSARLAEFSEDRATLTVNYPTSQASAR